MRSFCISLPETPERRLAAQNHFNERGLLVDFVSGINGESFGLRTTHEYVFGDQREIIAPAQVGLCLSHYMVWTLCQFLPDPYFLILEDDADLPADWQDRLDEALSCAPSDADLLYVGSCCCDDKPKERVKGVVWEVKYPFCTHALIVFRKALPTLLRTQRDVWAKIDLSLVFRTLPLLRCYTVLPSIIAQRGTTLHP